MQTLSSKFEPIEVDPANLLLDPNNPRYFGDFSDYAFVPHDQIGDSKNQEIAFKRLLMPRFGVEQLAKSIAQIGYLPIDSFVVTKYDEKRFKVIEGNRRLAAVMLILNGKVEAEEASKESIRTIPALLLKEPNNEASVDQWLIQGTRHIVGVKSWGPYQKARALETLHNEKGMSYQEASAAIGLTKQEANRAIRALTAFREFQDHPLLGKRSKTEHFSFFDEMIKKPSLRDYFGYDIRSGKFVDTEKRDFLFSLIVVPSGSDKGPKLKGALQLRELPEIIRFPESRASFEDLNQPLDNAIYLARSMSHGVPRSSLVSTILLHSRELGRVKDYSPSPEERESITETMRILETLLQRKG